jgi:uracil-DNA glycosylase
VTPTRQRTSSAATLVAERLALGERRRAALLAPHMRPLEAYRRELEAVLGPVPHFDLLDGGIAARCLLLLETPGPRAGAIRYVSRDNPTATARNITRFCAAAGLAREDTVIWNAVPWIIHAAGAGNRAPPRAEIEQGRAQLPSLLPLLPELRVVVLAGRVAGEMASLLREVRPSLAVLRTPHPSPVYVNTAPAIAPALIGVWSDAANIASEAHHEGDVAEQPRRRADRCWT